MQNFNSLPHHNPPGQESSCPAFPKLTNEESELLASLARQLANDPLATATNTILKYTRAARSEATERAYSSDWRDFVAFCEDNTLQFLPAQPAIVALYLAYLAEKGRRTATIVRRLASISAAHRRSGYPSPCDRSNQIVVETVHGIRRKLGVHQDSKAPLTLKLLRRVLSALPDGTIRGVRDRALILTGFAGGLRRSELARIRIEDLRKHRGGITIYIPQSKADQEKAGREIEIARSSARVQELGVTCPVQAIEHWIKLGSIKSGPLFRRLTRGQNIRNGLSPGSVAWILKRALKNAGLKPEQIAMYGAHSMRAGFATTAYENGAREMEISRQTGHRSIAMVRKYIHEEQNQRRMAARKLGL